LTGLWRVADFNRT